MFKPGDLVLIKEEKVIAKVVRYSRTYHNLVYIVPLDADESSTYSAFEDEIEEIKEECLC